MTSSSGPATGNVQVQLVDPDSLRNTHNYTLSFVDSTVFHTNPNPWYTLVDMTAKDTLLKMVRLKTTQDVTTVMQGFAVQINNAQTVGINTDSTRWKIGQSNLVTQVGFDSRYANAFLSRRVKPPRGFRHHVFATRAGRRFVPGGFVRLGNPVEYHDPGPDGGGGPRAVHIL